MSGRLVDKMVASSSYRRLDTQWLETYCSYSPVYVENICDANSNTMIDDKKQLLCDELYRRLASFFYFMNSDFAFSLLLF